ncbi:MAG: anaerobic ribonucleoside-triphosphate reductase [Planctomycetes bacterium]|nr:anaerobic ribonucleoside-triphosphate reductase [Planctomycetota bacterium]
MELMRFFEQVEQHPELEGIGVDSSCPDRSPGVLVKHLPSSLITRIPSAAIEEAGWDILEDVLVGKREPAVLQHMTRVVGYFSRVENWNKSKVGELKDRQKGNYSIAG